MVADQHLDRVEDDGFARARFSGQDDKSVAELEIKLVNDGEVLDVKFGEHLSPDANAGDCVYAAGTAMNK